MTDLDTHRIVNKVTAAINGAGLSDHELAVFADAASDADPFRYFPHGLIAGIVIGATAVGLLWWLL